MAIPLYNVRFMLLISATFITIFSSIAIYFCLPILISHVIRSQLALSPSSGSFEQWRLNSVVDRIYLYNITNLPELLQTRSSHMSERGVPIIEEVGPFTFRQIREKTNIKFDTLNETVLYDQTKRWSFMPDESVISTIEALKKADIVHVSVPLAGSTINPEYAELVQPIVSEFDLQLFVRHSVSELLFEGYPDILMENAKASGQIDVDRFGWMYNQNNSVTKNIRVFSGPKAGGLCKIGAMDQLNFLRHMTVWHNNGSEISEAADVRCNHFRHSSAGEFFPPPKDSFISQHNNQQCNHHNEQTDPSVNSVDNEKETKPSGLSKLNNNLTGDKISHIENVVDTTHDTDNEKSGRTISIYMPDLCRVFILIYNTTLDYKSIKVDRYIANEFTYDYSELNRHSPASLLTRSNDLNRCFCSYFETSKLTKCPPNGMMDLYNCRKGSSLLISFPHFLYSDKDASLAPYLKLYDDRVKPIENEHQFYMDLEPTLNIPVRAQIVLQFNVLFKNEPSLNFTSDYAFLFENSRTQKDKSPPMEIYLPQMWMKSYAEIDQINYENIKFIQRHLGLVTPLATLVMFCLASVLLTMSAKRAYLLLYGPATRKSNSMDHQNGPHMDMDSSDTCNEDKQKYLVVQLFEKSQGSRLLEGDTFLDKPTTSKIDPDLPSECQPLKLGAL